MKQILIINGPNLNMLGKREPNQYGKNTLHDLEQLVAATAKPLHLTTITYQSNAESDVIEKIHHAPDEKIDFIIINPGAWTHTSIALRDAFLSVKIPFIEVHLSNIFAREHFRHHSYLADIAIGSLCGFGIQGYALALLAAQNHLHHMNHLPE